MKCGVIQMAGKSERAGFCRKGKQQSKVADASVFRKSENKLNGYQPSFT
jgi:hypothetical protein